MTRTPDCTLSDRLVELIADEGFDALPELMRIMINAAMQAERQQPPTSFTPRFSPTCQIAWWHA